MTHREMVVLTDVALITCVVQRGVAEADRIDIEGSRRRFIYQQPIGLTTEFMLPKDVAEEEL